MDIQLTPHEARVIGCMIEKAKTTPEQYPLSLNALTNACNQKSNRDPVMSLDEVSVQQILDDLKKKGLVMQVSGTGSRVFKYRHRFCNTEFSKLQFSEQELACICVLLLRGAQTPGELRSRTNRLCEFNDVQEVENVLEKLIADGPYVMKLPRQAGKRESRYAHLFAGPVEIIAAGASSEDGAETFADDDDRLSMLEMQLADMQEEIDFLKLQMEDILSKPHS